MSPLHSGEHVSCYENCQPTKKWKVISSSNYDKETVSDKLEHDDLTEIEACKKAESLNAEIKETSDIYYRAVPQDYKLYKFEP